MSRGRVEDQCVTDGGEFFLLPVFCFFVLFWVFLHNLLIVIGQFLAPTTVHWRTKLNPNPYNAVAGQRLPSTGRK